MSEWCLLFVIHFSENCKKIYYDIFDFDFFMQKNLLRI